LCRFSSDKEIEELIKAGWHFPVILRGEGGEPIQGFPTISALNPDLHTGHKNLNIGHDNTGT
jgi:hypothetical protein